MLRFSVALALLSPASAAEYSLSVTSYSGPDWNGPQVPGNGWNPDWNNNDWADYIPPNGVQVCTKDKETPDAKYTFTSSFGSSATTDDSWCASLYPRRLPAPTPSLPTPACALSVTRPALSVKRTCLWAPSRLPVHAFCALEN